jgi:hypothetical protein
MTCKTDGEYTWRIVAGDDSTRVFEYLDSDEAPINLTGYTAVCLVDVGPVTASVSGSIEALTGKVTVTLEAALTETFRGNGEFRLKLTSGGGQVNTLVYGPLVVKL